MKLFKTFTVIFWLQCLCVSAIWGQTKGSAAEAMSLAARGLAHVQAVGLQKACEDFSAKDGRWMEGDLYVFVIRRDGLVMAHGANRGFVGKSMYELKDANGKEFVKEMAVIAKTRGSGWVDYLWPNPTTKKIEEKSSYVVAIPGHDAFVLVGYYRKSRP